MVMSKNSEKLNINNNSAMAASLLSDTEGCESNDLLEIYRNNPREIDRVEVETFRPSANILYMSELLIGHQDSAVDFYLDTVEQIKNLPEDMKPDLAVISGFMQGDFKYLQKSRRATLIPELNSMDMQFKYTREMIEKLQEIDRPVIYNISNDDRRIAEEYTIEVFRKMHELAKDDEEININWSRIDKMQQHPQWNTHLKFQITEVVPYCIRAGRRLYTAEEMAELTNGKIDIEEYFVLFGVDKALQEGTKVSKAHEKWVKDAKKSQNNKLIIADDFELEISTDSKKYTDSVRHYMGFSATPMYSNHLKTAISSIAQMDASGHKTPDMMVTQHNQEEVGVGHLDSWVISTGGLIRARNFLNAPGRQTDAKGDVSRRLVTTRRRIPEPSASMHERTDDGRYIITFFNEVLNEKSYSIPERMTIAELCDLQTGSITARPDILAKYLDFIRTRAIGERATAMFFGGDLMHGRNYPNFPSESQLTGLMAMDSQEDFNVKLFQESLSDMSREELNAITKVLVQPGNHEWNSGTLKWHGYSFTTYMRNTFERMYARAGFSDEEIAKRVKSHEATITRRGEYASGYTGVEYFGDMGVLLQHFLLDKGGNGGVGGIPVYQTQKFANGGGDLMKNVDIFMAGHWHHPQYGLFGNKLGLVGGSIAGISDYELKRGYRPTISGTLLHIGGGLPTQIEFIPEKTLHEHKITTGGFSEAQLKEEGYKDDRGFDPMRHGIFLPDRFAKSALQKKVLQMMRDASQRADKISELK